MKLSSVSGLACYVEDLDRSVEFYEALGFRIGKRESDHATCYVNWFWVDLIARDCASEPEPTDGVSFAQRGAGLYLYVKVDDLDDAYAAVLAAGMKPSGEPGGGRSRNREFVLRDPDGYRLVFFEK